MEVEHGTLDNHFPLQTVFQSGGGPLACYFRDCVPSMCNPNPILWLQTAQGSECFFPFPKRGTRAVGRGVVELSWLLAPWNGLPNVLDPYRVYVKAGVWLHAVLTGEFQHGSLRWLTGLPQGSTPSETSGMPRLPEAERLRCLVLLGAPKMLQQEPEIREDRAHTGPIRVPRVPTRSGFQ